MCIQDIYRREIEGTLSRVPDREVCEAHWAVCQGEYKEINQLAFVIYGLLELSSELPHQLMRLVLVGQVYRVMRINRGEPYHK